LIWHFDLEIVMDAYLHSSLRPFALLFNNTKITGKKGKVAWKLFFLFIQIVVHKIGYTPNT